MDNMSKIDNNFALTELSQNEITLNNFFSNVVWYGTPFVENFLNINRAKLEGQLNKKIWDNHPIGFKHQAHMNILKNDYQYLLAYVFYRFADLGSYKFAAGLYMNAISENQEAFNLMRIWELTPIKLRCCYTIFGISNGIIEDCVKNEFENIANTFPNQVSGRLAKAVLDISSYFSEISHGKSHEKAIKILGGRDPFKIINSEMCDGIR